MDEFSIALKTRIKTQRIVKKIAQENPERSVKKEPKTTKSRRHVAGQTGCFCRECLVHRHEEWRIGDINVRVVGPRNQWLQYSWGSNERGALSLGTTEKWILTPTPVPQLRECVETVSFENETLAIEREPKFVSLSSGKYHTMMVTESSKLFVSGDNSYGTIGIKDKRDSLMAKEVPLVQGEGKIIAVEAGGFSSYALIDVPSTNNSREELKRAYKRLEDAQSVVEQTGKGAGALAMLKSAQHHLEQIDSSIRKENSAHCRLLVWGRGARGCLGLGHTRNIWTPTRINGLDAVRVVEISAGLQHVLIRTELDGCFSFGCGDDGRLGHGDTKDRFEPTPIEALADRFVAQVSAGGSHSVVIVGEELPDRQVFSWGNGCNGRLGHGNEESHSLPQQVNALRGKRVTQLSCGGSHTLATSDPTLRKDGGVSVWSFGHGLYGQLGHRETWDSLTPRMIDEFKREIITTISAGERHSMAKTEDGTVYTWGLCTSGFELSSDVDLTTKVLLYPRAVNSYGLHVFGITAGYDRSFIWGDKATYGSNHSTARHRPLCSAVLQIRPLTSHNLRILYECKTCKHKIVCPSCASLCHSQHCIELYWTEKDALSISCDCFDNGDCKALNEPETS